MNSSPLGRLLSVVFVVALFHAFQWLTTIFRVSPHLGLSEDFLQQHPWISLYDHHFWQMVLALLVILLLTGKNWRRWGLNLDNSKLSLRIFWQFCLFYTPLVLVFNVLPHLSTGEPPTFSYALDAANVVGWLSFEWLFAGLSEEILFRGMMHSYLRRYWPTCWHWGRIEMPVAGFITAVFFALAHINFQLHPFEITHFALEQVGWAFGLGLYYSAVYHKTGSLLNPILAHNFSNGSIFLALYALAWLM